MGAWARGESERPTLQLAPRPDRLPLEGFLGLHDVATLTVLASAKAETDLLQALTALAAPFYSAQGHGDDVFLVDKYADECFATPSVLGLAIARAEAKVAGRRRDRGELADLRWRSGHLQAELDRTKTSEQRAAERVVVLEGQRAKRVHVDRQGVTLSWRTLLIVSGVLAFMFALLWIRA